MRKYISIEALEKILTSYAKYKSFSPNIVTEIIQEVERLSDKPKEIHLKNRYTRRR